MFNNDDFVEGMGCLGVIVMAVIFIILHLCYHLFYATLEVGYVKLHSVQLFVMH